MNETTTVENPNWPEANQLAIYKCRWEVEPGTSGNKFNEWSELVLNHGSPDLKASALTTGPHCLDIIIAGNRVIYNSRLKNILPSLRYLTIKLDHIESIERSIAIKNNLSFASKYCEYISSTSFQPTDRRNAL